jgi:DNA repair exonuclease SbcCD nuclease subunit
MRTDSLSIVFTADLHFDETGAWKYRGISGDAQHSFKQIVDFCCDRHARVLALGGDILDKPTPKPETIIFLRDQFDRLNQYSVEVVYILGQHDGRQDWPSIHPWPIHLHGKAFDVDDYVIYGLDYLRPADFMAAYAAPPKPESGAFLLCHQVWHEFMGNVRQAELSMANLPYATNLLTGDYHVHQVMEYTALDGSSAVAFSPGSTHVRDVAEEADKHFFAIYGGASAECECTSVTLITRPVRRYQIRTTEEAEAFLARKDLPLDGEGVKRAVVDISYYDDLDGLGAQLERTFGERCHLFLRGRNRKHESRAPSVVARRAVADRGLAGAVDLVCEPGPVRESAIRLLEALDPRAELDAMRAEFYASAVAEPQEVA